MKYKKTRFGNERFAVKFESRHDSPNRCHCVQF